jgi:pyrophosphate--fructose-6-phosphate 1-phosphotransferase
VANLAFDAISALKSYHICRVMGRDASHITLEVALQTHPNLVFISEEIAAAAAAVSTTKQTSTTPSTLLDIVEAIASLVIQRAAIGKEYGIVLIPEGLVGFVPDVKLLIEELNELLASSETAVDPNTFDASLLTNEARKLYSVLPEFILRQMMAERDPHGNVQVAAIETERLLGLMVRDRLQQLTEQGLYHGKFSFVPHYFGYEGRCAFPSKFDCDYTYTLGAVAGALLEASRTGMAAIVRHLVRPPHEWEVGGTPLTSMMNIERRKGKNKPVIKKKLVDLQDAPFRTLAKFRGEWMLTDSYRMPGPIQHGGSTEGMLNFTLMLEAEARNKIPK